MKMYHKIINGDSRQMVELKDESIHLVVTSPPYWQLKDYGTEDQIGFHDDYQTYINHLNLTWQEFEFITQPKLTNNWEEKIKRNSSIPTN